MLVKRGDDVDYCSIYLYDAHFHFHSVSPLQPCNRQPATLQPVSQAKAGRLLIQSDCCSGPAGCTSFRERASTSRDPSACRARGSIRSSKAPLHRGRQCRQSPPGRRRLLHPMTVQTYKSKQPVPLHSRRTHFLPFLRRLRRST